MSNATTLHPHFSRNALTALSLGCVRDPDSYDLDAERCAHCAATALPGYSVCGACLPFTCCACGVYHLAAITASFTKGGEAWRECPACLAKSARPLVCTVAADALRTATRLVTPSMRAARRYEERLVVANERTVA